MWDVQLRETEDVKRLVRGIDKPVCLVCQEHEERNVSMNVVEGFGQRAGEGEVFLRDDGGDRRVLQDSR
jgi:hypothetical protein